MKKEFLLKIIGNNDLSKLPYGTLLRYVNQADLLKTPIKMFFFGILESYFISFENINNRLQELKEVVEDILQLDGFEATCVDDDFNDLKIVKDNYGNLSLITRKIYMFEFFEI